MTNLTDAPTPDTPYNSTSHLREYLEYYKSLTNPGYGVLITGDWGSGKTFQVKEILTKEESYYISLFGAQSTEEVYSTVYTKMYPNKAKAMSIVSATEGTELETMGFTINIGGVVSSIANAFLREEVDPVKTIIFDDLERSIIDTKSLLGIFNKYIEHHGCRVVVIAHDEKIAGDLRDTKEKVFGQTIEVTPQTSNAFDNFTNALQDPDTKELIRDFKEDIITIFKQSSTSSLRILKYTFEDLGRLLRLLSSEHKSNSEAIKEISFLFIALSLEVRAGNLTENDLIERNYAITKFQMQRARTTENSPIPPIYEANKRQTNVDLGNLILKDQVLINMLIKGDYVAQEVHNSLDESLHFIKPESLPSWLLFMKFDEISDRESNAAAEKLKDQFNSRELCTPGEMLHLFALRFLLSEIGLIPTDFSETENDCRDYIDELLADNKIPVNIETSNSWTDRFMQGYNGHAFWVEDSYRPNFDNIVNHLKIAQGQATKNCYPEYSQLLINLVKTDGAAFAEQISPTFSGNNTFAHIDILASIEPMEFVQEWIGSHPRNWRHISRGLENRYSSGLLDGALIREKKWLSAVIDGLDREQAKLSGIMKKRIKRTLAQSLRDYASRV